MCVTVTEPYSGWRNVISFFRGAEEKHVCSQIINQEMPQSKEVYFSAS
jgi:hypothetical protein